MPIERICKSCGKTFYIKPSALVRYQGAGTFCSRACRKLGHEKPCDYCGKMIYVRPSEAKVGEGKYCSLRCRGKARSILFRGAACPRWKGGKRIAGGGKYVAKYIPDHPLASRGYVMEHRLVIEINLGRLLGRREVVHHINGDPADNRIENLKVFPSQAEHARYHQLNKPARGSRT